MSHFVLDTHILLWWFEEAKKLSPAQEQVLETISPNNPVAVSDITQWEIATLYSLGRLKFRLPLRDWLVRATAAPLVERVGITPAIAAEVAALPDSFHRDPADRLIVATTRVCGATLVTSDKRIIESDLVPTLS